MSSFVAKVQTRKILLPEQDSFSFSIESGREPLLLRNHFCSTFSLWPTFDVLSTFATSTSPRSPSTSPASLAPSRSTWSSWTSPPSTATSPPTSTNDVDASFSHVVRRSKEIRLSTMNPNVSRCPEVLLLLARGPRRYRLRGRDDVPCCSGCCYRDASSSGEVS